MIGEDAKKILRTYYNEKMNGLYLNLNGLLFKSGLSFDAFENALNYCEEKGFLKTKKKRGLNEFAIRNRDILDITPAGIDLIEGEMEKEKIEKYRIIFDTNLFDCIVDGRISISDLEKFGKNADFYITHIQVDEIQECKDKERAKKLALVMAKLRPIVIHTESFIVGTSRIGEARLGDSEILEKIRKGNLEHTEDALIGETAIKNDLLLITNDKRLRKRVISNGGKSIDVDELRNLLNTSKASVSFHSEAKSIKSEKAEKNLGRRYTPLILMITFLSVLITFMFVTLHEEETTKDNNLIFDTPYHIDTIDFAITNITATKVLGNETAPEGQVFLRIDATLINYANKTLSTNVTQFKLNATVGIQTKTYYPLTGHLYAAQLGLKESSFIPGTWIGVDQQKNGHLVYRVPYYSYGAMLEVTNGLTGKKQEFLIGNIPEIAAVTDR